MQKPSAQDILNLVIETLGLELDCGFDINTSLFGDGVANTLGLDSIDALEIGAVINQRYGVQLKSDEKSSRMAMQNVKTLHQYLIESLE